MFKDFTPDQTKPLTQYDSVYFTSLRTLNNTLMSKNMLVLPPYPHPL